MSEHNCKICHKKINYLTHENKKRACVSDKKTYSELERDNEKLIAKQNKYLKEIKKLTKLNKSLKKQIANYNISNSKNVNIINNPVYDNKYMININVLDGQKIDNSELAKEIVDVINSQTQQHCQKIL